MTAVKSAADFCRYTISVNGGRFVTDPTLLGAHFRKYVNIQRTPNLQKTVEIIQSLGIKIQAIDYLNTGGVNMSAQGSWHIHYSAQDKPATQKFDIQHELFEVIHKSYCSLYPEYPVLEEPQLSRYADRFAAAALIPPRFFMQSVIDTGCDIVKLGEMLELSHQCLIMALGQQLSQIPFVGAIYERQLQNGIRSRSKTNDYVATMVVKTALARDIKELCSLQPEPVINDHPKTGSLVCAALYSSHPVLYRSTLRDDSLAVLVRPVFTGARVPFRVICLAIPNAKSGRFSPQADIIETININEDSPCPSSHKCRNSHNCRWNRRLS